MLTTFKMGEEGLDLPHLDTLVVASPKKTVEQLVGRVTRKVGAGGARIYDVADSRVVMFSAMHRRRCGHYVRMGYRLMCFYFFFFFLSTTTPPPPIPLAFPSTSFRGDGASPMPLLKKINPIGQK